MTASAIETPPPFTAPYVPVGQNVRWIPPNRSGQKSYAATVVRKNADDSLYLAVYFPREHGQAGGLRFDKLSCLHKDDQRIHTDSRKRYGYWELTPLDAALRKLNPDYVALLRDFDE